MQSRRYDVIDVNQCLFVSLETGLIHYCPTKWELFELMAITRPFLVEEETEKRRVTLVGGKA